MSAEADKYELWTYVTFEEIKPGRVYLVKNTLTGQLAIKKSILKNQIELYQELKEIRIANLPEIFDILADEDNVFVLQEYINGQTLQDLINEKHQFTEQEITNYILQLCNVLKILHSQNPPIIHRDIKPANIILSNDGVIKLIDFDTARAYKANASTDTTNMGTAGFAAPEQFGFTQSDARSDIYALGVLMNVLLTRGNLPNERLYSGKLAKIIKKCTNLSPDKRYKNIDSLSASLKQRKKRILLFAAIGVIAAVLILFASYNWFFNSNALTRPSTSTAVSENASSSFPTLSEYNSNKYLPSDLLNQKSIQDQLHRLLSYEDYNYFYECLSQIDKSYYDSSRQSFTLSGAERGLYTIMEATIDIRQDGKIYAAFLKNNSINYFSNDDKFQTSVGSDAVLSWMDNDAYADRPIIFINAKKSEISVVGTYVNMRSKAHITIAKSNNAYEIEGDATNGANAGLIDGSANLNNSQILFIPRGYDKDSFLNMNFCNNTLTIIEHGVFGGMGVTFGGVYEKN